MTAPQEGSRIELAEQKNWGEKWSAYNNEQTWHALDSLHEVAGAMKRHPAQVAINWLLQKPGVTAPIIGAGRMEQLETNFVSPGWCLPPDQVAQIEPPSFIPAP